jgi:hypothetical protein
VATSVALLFRIRKICNLLIAVHVYPPGRNDLKGETAVSFTILFAVLALLALIVIFGISYARKGWKVAFLATGIALVLLAGAYVVLVQAITGAM